MKFKRSILEKKNTYIVGVSGGSDSMALLDILYKRAYHIVVCHVNYHIRKDSDEDSEIVKAYCKQYDIPFHQKDVRFYEDTNFEMQARDIRYKFYQDVGKTYNTNKVVLGHHQDDVLETIIMQLNRHNTIGYLGIKEISYVKDLEVSRPMLACNKNDLVNYCNNNNVKYKDDYTNFSTDYTRNYIRNITLKKYNEKEKNFLLRKAREHNEYLRRKDLCFKRFYDEYDKTGKVNYSNIDDSAMKYVIYYILKKNIYPPLISKGLIEEIIRELHVKKPNISISLPVNTKLIKEYDNVYVSKDDLTEDYKYIFNELEETKNKDIELSKEGHINTGVFISDEDLPITIRNYLPGDVIETSGGHKKVSRLFINNKIPANKRNSWPVVLNKDDEIILIPNLAKNVRYLSTKPNIFVIKL